jgi:hypothetical protein
MAKYSEELTEKIVSLIEDDTYTVTEICNHVGITRKSFYEWKEKKPEFREAVNKAIERRNEALSIIARNSLRRKLEGYTLTEIRTTYIPDKENPDKLVLKSRVVKEKEYAPDTQAIRLTLLPDDTKAIGVKEEPAALTIIVRDTKTAEQLNLLQNNLMHPSQEREPWHPLPDTGSPEKIRNGCEGIAGQAQGDNNSFEGNNLQCISDFKEENRPGLQSKRKPKSPDDLIRVRRDSSGYTCIIKRSELMPGEAFKDYVPEEK